MKKETLEEAAERIFGNNFNGMYHDDIDSKMIIMYAIDVAKWHQERSYSEEDLESVYRMALICGAEPHFIFWFEQFKKNKL